MQLHKEVLAKIAVEKSDEALKMSCKTIDESLSTAQNRAYYAVFYIVSALAYLDGFQSKSHHYLMGQFNKRYIHEQNLFDKSLTKTYSALIRDRESSDYDFTYKLTKEGVLADIEKAKTFIETVKPYILKRIQEE